MNDNDRIIFPSGEERTISKDKFERSQTDYEQCKKLIKSLAAWTAEAVKQLESFGYSTSHDQYNRLIFEKKIAFYNGETDEEYTFIYYYPAKIREDAEAEERSACEVLKAAEYLYESISTENKYLIANLGIQLGLAVAKANAIPFEELALSGKKSKEGYKNRQDQHRKEDFQNWLKNNPDRVCNITKKVQLETIPELERFTTIMSLETLASWFNEIYPAKFKGGRPKNISKYHKP